MGQQGLEFSAIQKKIYHLLKTAGPEGSTSVLTIIKATNSPDVIRQIHWIAHTLVLASIFLINTKIIHQGEKILHVIKADSVDTSSYVLKNIR